MSLQELPAGSGGVPEAAAPHDTSSQAPQRVAGRRGGLVMRRALVRGGLGLVLVGLLGFGLVARAGELPWAPAQTASAGAAPVVAAQNSAQDGAIQGVIQRSNAEQAQAIAANDPSVMADTATSDYYQQLQQINADLLSNGVKSIALANLEWGPITVSDTNATATTYETWQTTYSDGTSEQSRDQNNYTLVLQNGSWKIASDDHPSASLGQPGSASGAPAPSSPLPARNPGTLATSNNWSGYAATGGTYTAVSGTWTVPQYSATNSGGVDATWVGIGGVTSHDLIQAGTQETASGTGLTQYQAWIELLPQASHPVPLAVHPGDSVSVSIDQQSGTTWQIAFTNNTTGQTYQTTVQYTSSHSSAEWVEEAPSAGRGGILPLDNFGTVSFSAGATTKDGQTLSIAQAGAKPITLIGPSGQQLAVPSALGSDGSSFSVSRTQGQTTTPRTRTSPGFGFGQGGAGFGQGASGFGPGGSGFDQGSPGFGFGFGD